MARVLACPKGTVCSQPRLLILLLLLPRNVSVNVKNIFIARWYQTGVQYHFYHALGLIAVGLILLHYPESKPVALSGWLMLTGIVLFSVSLYALSLTGVRGLGVITPFGGVAFLSAWALLAYGVRAGVRAGP